MTTTTKNLLSLLFFAASLLFLMAATNITNSTELLKGDCHHCGSVSACNDGGQPYGYPNCEIIENPSGPDDCGVMGFPNCVSMPEPPPAEDPIE